MAPSGGNRNLRSEHSRSFEAGLLQGVGRAQMALTYFRIDYDHYIDFVAGLYRNTGDFIASGLEFEFDGPMGEFFLSQGHATFLRANNKRTNEVPLHRPQWRGGASLDYLPNDVWEIGIDGTFVGERESFSSERIHLPSYYTLDLRVSCQVGANGHLQIKMGNLMDHDYEEVAGYATLGRTIKAQYTLPL